MTELDIIEISDDSVIEPFTTTTARTKTRSFYEDESNDESFTVLEDPRPSSPTSAFPPSSLPFSSQGKMSDTDDDDELPDAAEILQDVFRHSNDRHRPSPGPSSSSPELSKRSTSSKAKNVTVQKPKAKRRRKTAEEKALEQAAKELEKAKKKEDTQRKKAEAAAQKAEDKAALKASKAINKLVIDKKTTLKDMIIEMSPRLVQDLPLFLPLKEKMAQYGCRIQPISSSGDDVELVDVKMLRDLCINFIRWKRHVKAAYNEAQRKWVPLPEDQQHLRPEGTYLIYVTGDDLVNCLGKHPTVPSLETQVSMLRHVLGPRYHIHLMICGWKGKTNLCKILDLVQLQLVTLQVKESLFVEEVDNVTDAVTWIYNISADLGIKPYKLIERSHLPFCPNSGNIKIGQTDADTFEKMLSQLPRLSEKSARAIVKQFGSIKKVMEEYEKAELRGNGPMMLANVPVPGSDRILNKALSERLYHLLWNFDPKVLIN